MRLLIRTARALVILPLIVMAVVFSVLIVVSLALEDCFSNWGK